MHRTLKIVLQNPLNRRHVHNFNSEAELNNILSKLQPHEEDEDDDVSDDEE